METEIKPETAKKQRYISRKVDTRHKFATQLRMMREEQGLSISELSKNTGISKAMLQQMELGSFNNWGALFQLSHFYDKQLLIEFI